MTIPAPPYRLRYELTLDAMFDASRLHHAGTYRLIGVAGAIMLISAGIVLLAAMLFDIGLIWFEVVLVPLGVFVLSSSRGMWPLGWAVKRQIGSALGTTTEMVLDQEGIAITTPYHTGFVKWSQLTGLREDERTVLFEHDRLLLGFAPSAAFGSPQERAAVVTFARQRIAAT